MTDSNLETEKKPLGCFSYFLMFFGVIICVFIFVGVSSCFDSSSSGSSNTGSSSTTSQPTNPIPKNTDSDINSKYPTVLTIQTDSKTFQIAFEPGYSSVSDHVGAELAVMKALGYSSITASDLSSPVEKAMNNLGRTYDIEGVVTVKCEKLGEKEYMLTFQKK